MTVQVFIFSYNRGKYLRNCVRSAIECVPGCIVTVIDDNSNDPETKKALREIENNKQVEVIISDEINKKYLGGLYGNMQSVLSITDSEWAFLLQDDMQFVRSVSKEDIERVERFFRKFENVALLYCSFLKHDKKETDEKAVVLDAAFPVYWYFNSCPYFRNKQRGFFADVGIFHLKRLRNVSWKWSDDRFENNKNYYRFFSGVGIDPYPAFMFLPFPVASKFKKQTLVQQVSQWVYRHSFYPYQKLQGEQLYYFMSRDLSSLPLADSYLYAPQSPSGHMTYSEAHRRSRILSRLDVIEKNLFHM